MLIAREQELEALIGLVAGPPAIAIVAGEAGVGKSRLVSEMVRRSGPRERLLIVGHCHPLREPFPLGPVLEALRGTGREPFRRTLSPTVGALRPLLPELAHVLPPRAGPAEDARVERHRVFRALRELLGGLGRCVCILEDLHWADEDTIEFLSFLVSDPPESLCLVLTYRSEQVPASSGLWTLRLRAPPDLCIARIDLPALTRSQVRQLASTILAAAVPEEFSSALHKWTAGIPFALEEALEALSARGDLYPANDRWPTNGLERLPIPPAVRNPIVEPMWSLSPDAALMAHAAAVIARPAGEALLRKVAGLAPLRGAQGLSEALSGALVEGDGNSLYGFRHALAARAVYEEIPGPERQRLHLRAAQALEALPQPLPFAELAHHFKRGGRPAKWLRYAEAAGDLASSAGDDRRAAELFQEILSAPQLAPASARRIALKLGGAALFGRTPRAAVGVLEAMLADGNLPSGVRGELRLSRARLLLLAGEGSAAEREMIRASEELRRRPALRARALANLAAVGPINGSAAQQRAWLEGALEAAAQQDESTIKTEVGATRAAFLLARGDRAGWGALDDLPWNTASHGERLELVRASKYLAQAAITVGFYDRAEFVLHEGERLRRELDHERFAVGLASVRAMLEWKTGRWQGLEVTTRGLIAASAEATGVSGPSELIRAWLLLAQGDLRHANALLSALLEKVQSARLALPLAIVKSTLATIHLSRGDARAARELTAMAITGIAERDLWACASTVAPVAVDALIACDERTEAEELVANFARGLRGRAAPAAKAALAHCRASLAQSDGRLEQAIRSFGSAERAWRALPAPYEAARARELRARCLLTSDERGAQSCLVAALEDFHALGASSDAGRVRDTLRAQGIPLPRQWRPGRKSYGPELSPREVEIARLVAMRRTNREIASELFISERTVEKHVSSALRKLGLASREGIERAALTAQKSSAGDQ